MYFSKVQCMQVFPLFYIGLHLLLYIPHIYCPSFCCLHFHQNGSQVFRLLKFDYHKSFWKTCLNLSEKSRGRISCGKVFVSLFWVFCFFLVVCFVFSKIIPVAQVWKIESIRVKRRNAHKWINVLSPTVENGVCFNQLLSTWFYISK